jgi:hypothetical protein
MDLIKEFGREFDIVTAVEDEVVRDLETYIYDRI